MTSSSNSSQSTRPAGRVLGMNYWSFLDFALNYEQRSGIFVPCITSLIHYFVDGFPHWENQPQILNSETILKPSPYVGLS